MRQCIRVEQFIVETLSDLRDRRQSNIGTDEKDEVILGKEVTSHDDSFNAFRLSFVF